MAIGRDLCGDYLDFMSSDTSQRMVRLMDLLKEGLEPFVVARLRETYGERWSDEARSIVYRNMPQGAPREGGIRWDTYGLLTVMTVRWSDCFAALFSRKTLSLVHELREIRNEVAHQNFKPEDEARAFDSAKRLLVEVDSDTARAALAKIEAMNKPSVEPSPLPRPIEASARRVRPARDGQTGRASKYDPLRDWLKEQGTERVEVTFAKVDELVDGLPKSAYEYQAWWGNQKGPHPQARAWREAGYRVDMVDLNGKRVRFVRSGG